MSFILDALRKSEIERQRQSGPSMAEFPVAREDRRLPVALVAIGFLLAVNLAVVLFFVLREEPAPAAQPPTAAQPAPAATVAATADVAPAAGAAPPGAAPAAVPGQPGSALGALVEPEEPPAVYYGEMPTAPPVAPDPTLLPESGAGTPSVIYEDTAPAESPPGGAPAGLPELSVDLHVFAADPAKRAVFINGRRYTQGARIAEGPTVEEITREGAVLSWRGRRFVLPRL